MKRFAGGLFRRIDEARSGQSGPGQSAREAGGARSAEIELHERNLADWRRAFGADHPHTLDGLVRLAQAYQRAGRHEEAIALLGQNLADRLRIHGLDAPLTLVARDDLGCAYREAGRLAEAVPLFEENKAEAARINPADTGLMQRIMQKTQPAYGGEPSGRDSDPELLPGG